jgi:hypothetical protein
MQFMRAAVKKIKITIASVAEAIVIHLWKYTRLLMVTRNLVFLVGADGRT